MAVQSDFSDDKERLTITVSGAFDYSTRDSFTNSYESHIDSLSEISVNLKEASYLDSAACCMLLILRDKSIRSGVAISEIRINSEIQGLFEAMDLASLFNVVLPD